MAAIKTRARRGRKQAEPGEVLKDQPVLVGDIVLDHDIQPRESINPGLVKEYAEAMEEGAQFPPVVLFRDADGRLVAADGFHRVEAAKLAKRAEVKADIHPGDERDAILYSVSANATHGLRRTDADKRRAVMRLLTDEEWGKWSASVIADKVGVSQPFVSSLRRELEGGNAPTTEVRTADGRTMSTGNLGGQGGRRRQRPTEEMGGGTNGHATIPQGGGDARAVLDAEPLEPTDPARQFMLAMMETLFRFERQFREFATDGDANDLLRSLEREELFRLSDGWNAVIDVVDKISQSITAVMEEVNEQDDEDEDEDDETEDDDEDEADTEDEDDEEEDEGDERVD